MSGQPLVPHEWLAQLSLGAAHQSMGLSGVVLLIAILIAATFTLAYQEMMRRNVFRVLALFVAALAALTSSLHWLARPHIFTFLFVAIWAYQLDNPKRRLWFFPVIMLLWANTHGAFIAGFVIWGAHMAGWVWESMHRQSTKETGVELVIIGATSFAVTFFNPAGWRLWTTSVGYFGSQFLVNQTIEYQSPNFHNWSTWPFLLMLAAGMISFSMGAKFRLHESMLFAGWTVLSLYSARNIPIFAIVAAPYIGLALQGSLERIGILRRLEQRMSQVESSLRGVVWPVLSVILLAVSLFVWPRPDNQFAAHRFPVQAVDWLHANPQKGKMFNNFVWGGYLLYRLWPEQKVFIDGQTDFYGEEFTREYTGVMALNDGWESVLAKYEVSWVIVQSDKPLVNALQDNLDWTIVYRDATATVLHEP
jgi:hypothetical protein